MFFRCFAHIVNLICKAMLEEAAGNVPELSPVKRLKSVISNVCVVVFLLNLYLIYIIYRYVHHHLDVINSLIF